MTTPDPRTDLAGYLGLTDEQAEQCRLFADAEGSISAKLGARLIEQDQARADEPDDGLIPVTVPEPVDEDTKPIAPLIVRMADLARDIVLNECKAARLTPLGEPSLERACGSCFPCLAADYLRGGADRIRELEALVSELPQLTVTSAMVETFKQSWHEADREGLAGQRVECALKDVLAEHVRLPPPEPVEGPPGTVPVTVRLTAEEVRAAADELATWTDTPSYRAVNKFGDACRAIDLPDPLPPWTSPLADLPDLTEEQCDYLAKLAAGYPCDVNDSVLVLVGRALIAAGYTPEEEA